VLCEDASVVVTTALMEEESVPQAESAKTAITIAAVLLNFIFSA
jgi:hypothetical protein